MRNLKKVLSLALALVMLVGMMVVGAGAAEYTDAGEIEYKEAVDVMSAIGVFQGMDGGKFFPEGNLTRAQAAKIITYMVLGKAVADKLPNTNSKFTDCPDGEWYVGSVNYLSDIGVVSGLGDGTFSPDGSVTSVEFSKMLLGILGYDAKIERFENDPSWAANIAVRARQANLTEDMTTQAINTQPINREQACQMAFNALKSDMQYYENPINVTTPDGTLIKVGGTLTPVKNDTGAKGHYNYDDKKMQFCEQYYPSLKLDSTSGRTDDFGRPVSVWTYDKEEIVTSSVTDTLLATYTKEMSTDAEKRQIANDLKGYTVRYNSTTSGGSTTTTYYYYQNGDWKPFSSSGSQEDKIAGLTGDGTIVEVYGNYDRKTCTVVVIKKTVATVSAAPTTRTNSDGEETVTIPGTTVRSIPTARVYGWEDLAKGDVVLVATGKNDDRDEVFYVEKAESITGVVSGVRSSDKAVRIDGAYYAPSKLDGAKLGWDNNFKDEYTFYLDNGGFVIAGTTEAQVSTPTQYAVVLANAWYQGTSLSTGEHGEVKLLLSDGTTVVGTVSKVNGNDAKEVTSVASDKNEDGTDKIIHHNKIENVSNDEIVKYTVNSDGKYELTTSQAETSPITNTPMTSTVEVTKGAANVKYNTNKKQPVNSGTIFFVETVDNKGKSTYNAYVGNDDVPSMTSESNACVVYKNNAGMAVAVYIRDNKAVDNSASDYVYIPKDVSGTVSPIRYESVVSDGKISYWEVNGVVFNGEDGQILRVSTGLKNADTLKKGVLYKVDKTDASTEAVTEVTPAELKLGVDLGKKTVTVNTQGSAGTATAYAVTEDTQIIRITVDQTVQTIDWDGSFNDTTDHAVVVQTSVNSGVAKAVYIIEDQSPDKSLTVTIKVDNKDASSTTSSWTGTGESKDTAKTATVTASNVDAEKDFKLNLTVHAEADYVLMEGDVPTKTAKAGQKLDNELIYMVTAENGKVCWYKLTLNITSKNA